MLRRTVVIIALAAIVASCSASGSPANGSSPGTTSAATASLASGSGLLAALDPAEAATYSGSRRDLVDLLIGPADLGGYRLLTLKVDDPNNDGHIDGRWYPPRIVTSSCQVRADNAPIPTAGAMFIPGDPGTRPNADALKAQQDAFSAPHSISISVLVFDDASQRDAFDNNMRDLYRAMGTVSFGSTACGGSGTSGKALVSLSETTPHPAGYPAFAVKGRMLITPTVLAQYRVGERVLLTVATQNGFSDAATATADPDPKRIVRAIDAQIARLKAKGLG